VDVKVDVALSQQGGLKNIVLLDVKRRACIDETAVAGQEPRLHVPSHLRSAICTRVFIVRPRRKRIEKNSKTPNIACNHVHTAAVQNLPQFLELHLRNKAIRMLEEGVQVHRTSENLMPTGRA
jgi:hypothetical protein